jgi:hypothetical protein
MAAAATGVETRRGALVRQASMVAMDATQVKVDMSALVVYNVPPTCPLTSQPFSRNTVTGNLNAVYCPAISAVCDRDALTNCFVRETLAQLRGPVQEESVKTGLALSAAEPSTVQNPYIIALARASSETFHRVHIYYLGASESEGRFKLGYPSILSITKSNTRLAPAIADRPDFEENHEINELIRSYMNRKSVEEETALIQAIHAYRTEKGLLVDPLGNGPDLSDLDLRRFTFHNLNLEGRRVVNTVFDHCVFKNCNLTNVGFISCDLTKAVVESSQIGGPQTSFYKTIVEKMSFEPTNNSQLYLETAYGLPPKRVTTKQDYQRILESLGAVSADTLRDDRATKMAEGQAKFARDMTAHPEKYNPRTNPAKARRGNDTTDVHTGAVALPAAVDTFGVDMLARMKSIEHKELGGGAQAAPGDIRTGSASLLTLRTGKRKSES